MTDLAEPEAEFLLYQTEDGRTSVEVRFEGDPAWLTQASLAELFQTTQENITQHVAAIDEDGELVEEATCKGFLQVRLEGARQVQRRLKHYNRSAGGIGPAAGVLLEGFTEVRRRTAEGSRPDGSFDYAPDLDASGFFSISALAGALIESALDSPTEQLRRRTPLAVSVDDDSSEKVSVSGSTCGLGGRSADHLTIFV